MDFTQEFISNCIQQNKTHINDILAQAKEEIKQIDLDLKKMEVLRARQINLRAMLRQLGALDKQTKAPTIISVTEGNDPAIKNIESQICDYFELDSRPKSIREILDNFDSADQSKLILIAIKNLVVAEILQKNNDSSISVGANWDR